MTPGKSPAGVPLMALVTFGELTVELQRKGIKICTSMCCPLMDGCVYRSCFFVRYRHSSCSGEKTRLIRQQQAAFVTAQPRQSERKMCSERLTIFGGEATD